MHEARRLDCARGMFDVGIVTAAADAALAFWTETVGLPLVETIEPVPGVRQHRLDLHGAVFKLNCVARVPDRARRSGLRLLTIPLGSVSEPVHLSDPDGNLVHLTPLGGPGHPVAFAMHLAVSDESSFESFLGGVLALDRVGDRTYDLNGAHLSFSWSPDVRRDLPTGPPGYSYITIQVRDAAAAHELLVGRGARELRPPSAEHFASASIVSFVADPDGNSIEISQRPDLLR